MHSGQPRTLLLVDDEPASTRLVAALAARAGWRTIAVPDGGKAMALIADRIEPVDAVLIDIWRPAASGAALVGEMRARWPALPIVMLTAQASIGLAVEAMRAGASDFLLKPIAPDSLFAALDAASLGHEDQDELRPLAENVGAGHGFDAIVGSAPALRGALAAAAIAARSRAPALITGPAGSGKDLVARAIHGSSSRGRRPPCLIHCGALPAAQVDAELFGDRGAVRRAAGGTLILAETPALSNDAQARLLSLVDDEAADVRIIALALRPLAEAVADGRFRADLADALAAHEVRLPPLAERRGDIPALARHLAQRIGRQPGMRVAELTDAACTLLAGHDWPGNVRQLHDTLFRAALAAEGPLLTAQDFPALSRARHGVAQNDGACDDRRPAAAGIELYGDDGHVRRLEDVEADIIRLAIGHYRGRMSEVARRLGIGRSTLYRKLVELGLDSKAA